MSAELPVPEMHEVGLDAVLAALADPMRRGVIVELMRRADVEHACASFDLPVAKSTRTHHWRVLRSAGLIRQREAGNGSFVWLRAAELGDRFPGLLDAVARAEQQTR